MQRNLHRSMIRVKKYYYIDLEFSSSSEGKEDGGITSL